MVTGCRRLPPTLLPALLPIGAFLACWLCFSPAARAVSSDRGAGAMPAQEQSSGGDAGSGAPPACGATGPGEVATDRDAIVAWFNQRRAEEKLPALTPQPVLCGVAQERAEGVARAGLIESSSATVSRISRRLLARGYAAHLWRERSLLGYRKPVAMVQAWARSPDTSEGSVAKMILGEFEDVGVGVAPGENGTAVVLLFAIPRSTWLLKEVAPLEDLEAVRRQALEAVNEARKKAGRGPVRENADLDRAAQAHAGDMIANGYYGHVSPTGVTPSDWVEKTDYPLFSFLSENIAKGLFTPAEAVERWLGSRHHRRNILDSGARETGLGLAWGEQDGELQVVWVQLFSAPR